MTVSLPAPPAWSVPPFAHGGQAADASSWLPLFPVALLAGG
ncbi:hypothetical protein [Micromonospora sp. NPDC005203]